MMSKHLITFQDKTLCIAEWARELGLSEGAIQGRIELGHLTKEVLNPNHFKRRGRKKGSRNRIKKGVFIDDTFMEPI